MNRFIERYSPLFGWLGGLGIPVAVVVAGWIITTGTETSKLESEYVQIALRILTPRERSADGKNRVFTEDEKALRQWAVRLLNRQSPEKFTEAEQKALLNIQEPFGDIESLTRLSLWSLLDQMIRDQSKDKDATPMPHPERLPGPNK